MGTKPSKAGTSPHTDSNLVIYDMPGENPLPSNQKAKRFIKPLDKHEVVFNSPPSGNKKSKKSWWLTYLLYED